MLTKQLAVTVTVLKVITDHKSLVLFNIIAPSKKQTWNFEKAIQFKALRVINCRTSEIHDDKTTIYESQIDQTLALKLNQKIKKSLITK